MKESTEERRFEVVQEGDYWLIVGPLHDDLTQVGVIGTRRHKTGNKFLSRSDAERDANILNSKPDHSRCSA
jgi:hypothetical protein